MVRTGIAMYGLSPDVKAMGDSKKLGLKPVMQLRAKLHLVKQVPAGSPVGYGATAVTEKETKLGVVAMGYADGIPRIAQGGGVFIDGKKSNESIPGASNLHVKIEGMIGDLTVHGDVTCGNVGGDVSAVNVTCRTIEGDVSAAKVDCDTIEGDVSAASVRMKR
jgi:hypothetical protein